MATSRIRGAAALAVVLGVLLLPPLAEGDHQPLPNYPALLPPSQNAPGTVSVGFDVCPEGGIECPEGVIAEMYRRWRPLNNRCDHKAVFALTYLRTTEEFFRTVKRDPKFSSDPAWINHEDTVFAQLYFNPADAWTRGRSIPGAWRVAFEASESPDVTGTGDLMLGMSAHINRDLPFTLAHVGLVKPDGTSRKPDHDKVNVFLDRVADPLQEELARRYDPIFEETDAKPSPLDETGVLQGVRSWREQAWRNAERLVNAKSDEERKQVADSIDSYAEGAARGILAANTVPGYGARRDAYCRAHNTIENEPGGGHAGKSTLPLTVKIYNTGLRRLWRSGRLSVKLTAGGPGTVRISAALRPIGLARRSPAFTGVAARQVTIAARTVVVAKAGARRLGVRLTRRGRKAVARYLRARRAARITASGRLRDRAGRSRSARAAKTLRR
jgi:hypothetical protein